jgi:hypothetical protein
MTSFFRLSKQTSDISFFFWKCHLNLPPRNTYFNINNTNHVLGGRIYCDLVCTLASYLFKLSINAVLPSKQRSMSRKFSVSFSLSHQDNEHICNFFPSGKHSFLFHILDFVTLLHRQYVMESKNYEPPHHATFSLSHHFPVFDRNIFRNCQEEPLVYVLPL